MVAKQTEKTIYRTVDKNTQNKNTVKKIIIADSQIQICYCTVIINLNQ